MAPRDLSESPPRLGRLSVLLGLAVVLELAAGGGLAFVVGFGSMHHSLLAFQPDWLPLVFVGVAAPTFLGYYLAASHIYRADDGAALPGRQMRAVVMAGFGAFLSRGGTKLDEQVLRSAGLDERDARVRVEALGGLEHGALGLVGCVAGIIALASSQRLPPIDFKLPWTILPVPGFLLAFWLAGRAEDRYAEATGWRKHLGIGIQMILFVRRLFAQPRRHGVGVAGMVLFWVAGAAATWAALACFGAHVNGAAFMLGFGTGAVFTRRTGPLAGAGLLMLCLPLTLWDSGAPFAAAVLGVFVYRFVSAWLPTPLALWSLRTVREVGGEEGAGARGEDRSGARRLATP